jgi:PIN domain nuclease of toxin-antitoxin system
VNLLLDTHAFLWWLKDDPKLGEAPRIAISDPESSVWVSAATIWEIAIKRALGKLQVDIDDLAEEIGASGFLELPISARHSVIAGGLPRHHDDPFDRMLIAQAQNEDLTIITRDSVFQSYAVALISA